ncbi:MAG: hypothetical protein AB1414_20415 [bacterium]
MKKLLILAGLLSLLSCGFVEANDYLELGMSINKLDKDKGIVTLSQLNINAQPNYVPRWLQNAYVYIGTDFGDNTGIGGGLYFMDKCIGFQGGLIYDEERKNDEYSVGMFIDVFRLLQKELE